MQHDSPQKTLPEETVGILYLAKPRGRCPQHGAPPEETGEDRRKPPLCVLMFFGRRKRSNQTIGAAAGARGAAGAPRRSPCYGGPTENPECWHATTGLW